MSNKDQAAKINRAEKTATRSSTSPAKLEDQATLSSSAEAKQTFQQTRVDPQALHPHDLLRLQRSVGNRAVQRLLTTRTLQAKLTVGAAHDPYEEEADAVAGQVMRMSAAPIGNGGPVQRTATEDEEELQAKPLSDTITPLVQRTIQEEELQTKRASAADSFETGEDFENRLNATRGGGTPLPDTVRGFMEPRFGADFSGVRLHTGTESAQLNREVSAQAFTLGSDIYLGEGRTNVTSNDGQQLLAHELTHVVQQTGTGNSGHSQRPAQRATEEKTHLSETLTPFQISRQDLNKSIQRLIIEDNDDSVNPAPLNDEAIQAGIDHLPYEVQQIIWEIHAEDEFAMTLAQAIEMALAESSTPAIQNHKMEVDTKEQKQGLLPPFQSANPLVEMDPEKELSPQLTEIQWGDPRTGKLVFYEGNWLILRGSYYYRILNLDQIPEKCETDQSIQYRLPVKDYQHAKDINRQIGELGGIVISIADQAISTTLSQEKQQTILGLQNRALELRTGSAIDEGKTKRYAPQQIPVEKMKYKVQWQQAPKTITGNVDARQMLKSLDIKYQLEHKEAKGKEVGIEGESIHKELFSRGPAHGNEVHVRFQLVYQQGETIGIAPGPTHYFGSGKTESDSTSKHQKADEIASMLVHSGQINSVTEYNDEAHAHSEQEMIVHLSQNVSLFDHALKLLQSQKATVVALLIDMNSAPNTVCDKCHPSLSTFLTTTNWKDLVTQHLQESLGKGAAITLNKPPLILRVSANTKFRSQHVTNAIAEAKKSYTVIPDAADVHFLERIPYESWF